MINPDKEIDVSGMSCPIPLIRLSQSVSSLGGGKTLKIVGDDPVFERGVRDYCEINRLEIISVSPLVGRTVEIIIKKTE